MGKRLILERLIKEGEGLKRYIWLLEGYTEDMIEAEDMIGVEYRRWVSKCTLILETNYSINPLTKKFIYASSNNSAENYETMLKIMKAIEVLEESNVELSTSCQEALG